MFIHRSQYFLIDYNLIFLSQFSNPFLFEHILIVGNHQRLDIRILLRSLFQDLSISCIYRILLENSSEPQDEQLAARTCIAAWNFNDSEHF